MELAEYEKMYRFEGNYWWWVGKKRIVKGILNKLQFDPDSRKALDVGCGAGTNLKDLDNHSLVIGLDSSKDALHFCRMRGYKNLIQGDAESLPFKDDAFDLITAFDLLEHVDDDKTTAAFHRVLKPNGFLVLTVPAWGFLWSKHDEALHHKRRYSKGQFRAVLEANGFIIEKVSYWNFFLFLPIAAMRLITRIVNSQEARTDVKELPGIINGFLSSILRIESYLVPRVNLPFGISLVCIAKVIK